MHGEVFFCSVYIVVFFFSGDDSLVSIFVCIFSGQDGGDRG